MSGARQCNSTTEARCMDYERISYRETTPLALVIGCGDMGTGIARALARTYPVMIADIDADRLEKTVAMLRAEGFWASGQVCNITSREQVAALSERLRAGPGVRVLAHVAALGNSPLGWRAVLDVDLIGAHLIAEAVGPHMVRGGVGIFISSKGALFSRQSPEIDALLDAPHQPDFHERLAAAYGEDPHPIEAYFMAKRGMNRLSEALAVKWAAKDVRCLTVSPGFIDSTMARTGGAQLPIRQGDKPTAVSEPRGEKMRREVPLQRHGTLQEVTEVVAFLASDSSSYMTGIDMMIDGGQFAYARVRARQAN